MAKHDLDLAAKFFFVFARFEYALKMTGFLRPVNVAKIDWRAVAEKMESVFIDPKPRDFAEAVEYICQKPPKKQCCENKMIIWRESIPQTNLKSDVVLQYVRRVRNNLFHRGKFSGGYLDDPPRAEQLMNCGIQIVNRCVDEIPMVREAYYG